MTGFADVPAVFPPETMAEIRENLVRYMRDIAPGLKEPLAFFGREAGEDSEKAVVFLGRMDMQDDYFARLKKDPRLGEIAEDLLGCEVEAQHVQMLNIIPRLCSATPPHQDAPIFSIEPNHAATFWIPITDVDERSGCLHYVPGSHWLGYQEHAKSGSRRVADFRDYLDRGVPMPVKAGGLIAHHCLTVHYSSENLTSENRWALAIHFFPVGSRAFKESDWIRRQSVAKTGSNDKF